MTDREVDMPNGQGALDRTAAYETFYGAHASTVHRAVCLALGDAELGADATAEALARAYERWDDVRSYDNPSGWVYRVALNWARTQQRRRRWRDRRPVPDRGWLHVPGDPDLAAALAALTTDGRTVVVCRYFLDWSVDQTATALEIPAGTVKSRLARALETLKRRLEDSP